MANFPLNLNNSLFAIQVKALQTRMTILDRIDEKLQNINDFIKRLQAFNLQLGELEAWNKEGRQRMNDLLEPSKPLLPEERVMYTMELQSDVEVQLNKHQTHEDEWNQIKPTDSTEQSSEAEVSTNISFFELCPIEIFLQSYVTRLEEVKLFLSQLLSEVKTEGEKFGEDIKHLADFTSGCKRFEPWILDAEARKIAGLKKPRDLGEARLSLAENMVCLTL